MVAKIKNLNSIHNKSNCMQAIQKQKWKQENVISSRENYSTTIKFQWEYKYLPEHHLKRPKLGHNSQFFIKTHKFMRSFTLQYIPINEEDHSKYIFPFSNRFAVILFAIIFRKYFPNQQGESEKRTNVSTIVSGPFGNNTFRKIPND